MHPKDFSNTKPRFRLEAFFDGRSRAWGLFQDRFGNVRKQFVVDIDGTWDGETLTLVEDFAYDDGGQERRIWTIHPNGRHGYRGAAKGVVGTATGSAYGNALNWRYHFDLDIGERKVNVRFDDWMFLQPDGKTMINRAQVSKWGIVIGTASIFFQRLDQCDGLPPADPAARLTPPADAGNDRSSNPALESSYRPGSMHPNDRYGP